MSKLLAIFGIPAIAATFLFASLVYSPHATTGVNFTIEAEAPPMPLLKTWLACMRQSELPSAIGKTHKFVTSTIEGMNWNEVGINRFQAKFYKNSADLVSIISYTPKMSSEQSQMRLLYWNKQGFHQRNLNNERDGWIYLIGNKTTPYAISRHPPRTDHYEQDMQLPGQLTAIYPEGASIGLQPLQANEVNVILPQQYFRLFHEREKILTVNDLLSGKPVMQIPNPPSDWSDTSGRELDQQQVENGLMVGGIESTPGTGNNFIWYNLPQGSRVCKTVRHSLAPASLTEFLPKPLQTMKPILEDMPLRPKIWKDGSIIFRLICEEHKGGDNLRFIGIVKQSQEGSPKLLTWAIYHSFQADFNNGSGAYADQSKVANSKTFSHVWFPASNGQVESAFQRTEWPNDFFFDVDAANNSVIYLLGGQLWVVDIASHQ